MSDIVYLNGQWLAAEDAKVSVFDRGFLFADGIYEVVSYYHGQPFLIDQHLKRLTNSLKALAIPDPGLKFWHELLGELAERNQLTSGLVYIQVTRGADTQRTHLPRAGLTPTVFATVTPMSLPHRVDTPVNVAVMEDIRWLRCDLKSISLLGNIMLKQQADSLGAVEPLLVRDGMITEGASCNYFMVVEGVVFTPPKSHLILPGVTRDWVIELARENGFQVREEEISLAQFKAADECFLTSTSREIMPISYIDNEPVGRHSLPVATPPADSVTEQLLGVLQRSKPLPDTANLAE